MPMFKSAATCAALGIAFIAAFVGSSGRAVTSEEGIAGYCLYFHENSIYYRTPVFRAAKFNRHRFVEDWKHHLYENGVNYYVGVTCRAWPGGADGVASAQEAAATPPEFTQRIVDMDWIPEDAVRASGGGSAPFPRSATGGAAKAKAAPVEPAPYESARAPAAPKYVEVAGPDGKTIRLSPEVAERNKAAAEEYRRKMEEHAQAKADHDRRLAEHQQNAANAAAAKQAHERVLAAKAAEVAAHKAAMDDYNKKLAGASTNDDPNRCITSPAIKPGLRGNTEVHVTNGCDQKVDIVICLKRTSGDWLCGAQFGILSQRSMSFMSTNATGEIYVDAVTFGSKNKLGRPAGIIK